LILLNYKGNSKKEKLFQIGDLKTIHPAMVEETGFDLRKLEQE